MKLIVKKNNRDWRAFQAVRNNVEFINYENKEFKKAIKSSLYTVVVYDNKNPVAVGRVIGDKRIAFFLKDIAVLKNYQNRGIGKIVMETLLDIIYKKCANYAYIGLMSTPNKETFYEKFGFIKRPTSILGSGMVKFYGKK